MPEQTIQQADPPEETPGDSEASQAHEREEENPSLVKVDINGESVEFRKPKLMPEDKWEDYKATILQAAFDAKRQPPIGVDANEWQRLQADCAESLKKLPKTSDGLLGKFFLKWGDRQIPLHLRILHQRLETMAGNPPQKEDTKKILENQKTQSMENIKALTEKDMALLQEINSLKVQKEDKEQLIKTNEVKIQDADQRIKRQEFNVNRLNVLRNGGYVTIKFPDQPDREQKIDGTEAIAKQKRELSDSLAEEVNTDKKRSDKWRKTWNWRYKKDRDELSTTDKVIPEGSLLSQRLNQLKKLEYAYVKKESARTTIFKGGVRKELQQVRHHIAVAEAAIKAQAEDARTYQQYEKVKYELEGSENNKRSLTMENSSLIRDVAEIDTKVKDLGTQRDLNGAAIIAEQKILEVINQEIGRIS